MYFSFVFLNFDRSIILIGVVGLEVWFDVESIKFYLCSFQALPADLTRLPLLEKLYLENNKLSVLPPELGEIKSLKVLRVDSNLLISVPGKPVF